MATNVTQPLVWIDLETTGLQAGKDVILEIACIITDGHLNRIMEGPNVIIKRSDEVLLSMEDWSWHQHNKTGLVQQCRGKSSVPIQEAEKLVLDFVKTYVPYPKTALLAGSSVHFDKEFLRAEMPDMFTWLHYRIVDVSTIGELVKRWYPNIGKQMPKGKGTHRALDDIRDSIRQLQYYKKHVFRMPDGSSLPKNDICLDDVDELQF